MIISYVLTGAIVLISLVIQGHASFNAISLFGVKPDLLFIAIIYLSYSFGAFYGEVTAFISGIFHDAISNSPLGLLTFPKVALALIVGLFGRSVFKSNIMTISLLVFAASIVKGIITLLLCYIFHHSYTSAILSVILPEAFYNALISPLLFFIFDKIYEKDLQREGYR